MARPAGEKVLSLSVRLYQHAEGNTKLLAWYPQVSFQGTMGSSTGWAWDVPTGQTGICKWSFSVRPRLRLSVLQVPITAQNEGGGQKSSASSLKAWGTTATAAHNHTWKTSCRPAYPQFFTLRLVKWSSFHLSPVPRQLKFRLKIQQMWLSN